MGHVGMIAATGFALALVAGWLWRRWRAAQRQAQRELAILQFDDEQNTLEQDFLVAAAASGKPRGLRWKACELHPGRLFAFDRVSDELYALAGVTISFEAIQGGDMEEVEAVGDLRYATAIFAYRHHRWTTDGQVVFNLEPAQALEHYRDSLESF